MNIEEFNELNFMATPDDEIRNARKFNLCINVEQGWDFNRAFSEMVQALEKGVFYNKPETMRLTNAIGGCPGEDFVLDFSVHYKYFQYSPDIKISGKFPLRITDCMDFCHLFKSKYGGCSIPDPKEEIITLFIAERFIHENSTATAKINFYLSELTIKQRNELYVVISTYIRTAAMRYYTMHTFGAVNKK